MLYLIFGKKGSGKTYLAKKLIENKHSLIIYDVNNEYTGTDLILTLPEFKQRILKNKFPIRCYFADEAELEKSFKYIEYIKNCIVLIDEFHLFSNKYQKKSNLFKLVRLQRHKNLTFIGVSQRISDIATSIFSQTDYIVTFKQTELRDLEILEKFGFDPEAVKNLAEYKCLIKKL